MPGPKYLPMFGESNSVTGKVKYQPFLVTLVAKCLLFISSNTMHKKAAKPLGLTAAPLIHKHQWYQFHLCLYATSLILPVSRLSLKSFRV